MIKVMRDLNKKRKGSVSLDLGDQGINVPILLVDNNNLIYINSQPGKHARQFKIHTSYARRL
jgi:hypothetical protein